MLTLIWDAKVKTNDIATLRVNSLFVRLYNVKEYSSNELIMAEHS